MDTKIINRKLLVSKFSMSAKAATLGVFAESADWVTNQFWILNKPALGELQLTELHVGVLKNSQEVIELSDENAEKMLGRKVVAHETQFAAELDMQKGPILTTIEMGQRFDAYAVGFILKRLGIASPLKETKGLLYFLDAEGKTVGALAALSD